jgi:hypothetical protein
VKLRLVKRQGGKPTEVHFADAPNDFDFPASILVQIPNHYIVGERYSLQSVPLRTYSFTNCDLLPSKRDRPTRSEQSLEGTAVNGPIPVGQEDEL